MAYSKLQLGTINMLYSLEGKIDIVHPYLPIMTTSPQWPLSSFCPQARWPLWKGLTVNVETKVRSIEDLVLGTEKGLF